MDWVGQNLGRKDPRASQLAEFLGRPAKFYVGLAHGFEDMCLHKE
jgi:hypothetical protein